MSQTLHTMFAAMILVGSVVGVGVVAGQSGTAPQQQTDDGTPVSASDTDMNGPFTLTTEDVSICGLTCREVTVTLSNQRNETLRNITVESDITADGEVIAQRQTEVERLRPNESVTRTVRVTVGFGELQQIRRNDGTITIETQVASDRYNQTFTSERTVV